MNTDNKKLVLIEKRSAVFSQHVTSPSESERVTIKILYLPYRNLLYIKCVHFRN